MDHIVVLLQHIKPIIYRYEKEVSQETMESVITMIDEVMSILKHKHIDFKTEGLLQEASDGDHRISIYKVSEVRYDWDLFNAKTLSSVARGKAHTEYEAKSIISMILMVLNHHH